jgi:hypothetical protein
VSSECGQKFSASEKNSKMYNVQAALPAAGPSEKNHFAGNDFVSDG